jgi:hypothetical protein
VFTADAADARSEDVPPPPRLLHAVPFCPADTADARGMLTVKAGREY